MSNYESDEKPGWFSCLLGTLGFGFFMLLFGSLLGAVSFFYVMVLAGFAIFAITTYGFCYVVCVVLKAAWEAAVGIWRLTFEKE